MVDSEGSIAGALRRTRLLSSALIVVIAVATLLIGLDALGSTGSLVAQIVTAVAGAALGNYIRLDISQHVVRNQSRPATRHLLDTAARLNGLVSQADRYQAQVREHGPVGGLDMLRVADWFGVLGEGMRREIDATVTSIDDWSDMARDVVEGEAASYRARPERLAPSTSRQENS